MPKSKSKKKPSSASKTAKGKHKITANVLTITVKNTAPSPDPAPAVVNELITFSNSDTVPYLIQLFAPDGDAVMVEVLLGAGGLGGNGTVKLMANGAPGSCTYNLLAVPAAANRVMTGGGTHTITISNTAPARPKAAAASA
jgi:hypothetical protein